MRWIMCAIAALIWVSPIAAVAQQQAGSAFEETATGHIMALEQAAMRPLDELIEEFETQRFSASYMAETTAGERRALLSSIRDAAAAAGGVGVD
ncbi:MAG: hypothetical protein HKN78_07995, partial [Sphingomonadaceae bacterium]|nr:hypothetical protein [Sphingomonadaceae bacterium]